MGPVIGPLSTGELKPPVIPRGSLPKRRLPDMFKEAKSSGFHGIHIPTVVCTHVNNDNMKICQDLWSLGDYQILGPAFY